MRTRDKICLYTLHFPYGMKEISVQVEMSFLSRAFQEVYVLAGSKSDGSREQAANVIVVDLFENEGPTKINLIKAVGLITKNLRKEFLKNIRYELSYQSKLFQRAEKLKQWIINMELQNSVHYTHWFDEWATLLAMVKKDIPELKIVARAHGFDLYNERSKYGYFPYRKMQLEAVEKVFAVSKMGANYLKRSFPEYAKKISMQYLGIDSLSRSPFKVEPIHILSISNVIPLKRIGLLVEALKLVRTNVKWTHFGAGDLFEELKEQVKELPENIEYELKGFVPNQEMLRELSELPINLFVNLSITEGLPLSMMEVMSAGIPVMATDVGGVKEIVNNRTGILLSEDISPKEIADILESFEHHTLNSVDARKLIMEYWSNHFDARKNVHSFVHYLQSIN